jgi:hypothetical protein
MGSFGSKGMSQQENLLLFRYLPFINLPKPEFERVLIGNMPLANYLKYLKENQKDRETLLSLKANHEKYGKLTEKQIALLNRICQNAKGSLSPALKIGEYYEGEVEITALKIKQSQNIPRSDGFVESNDYLLLCFIYQNQNVSAFLNKHQILRFNEQFPNLSPKDKIHLAFNVTKVNGSYITAMISF